MLVLKWSLFSRLVVSALARSNSSFSPQGGVSADGERHTSAAGRGGVLLPMPEGGGWVHVCDTMLTEVCDWEHSKGKH